MEIKITKDMHDWLCVLIEQFNKELTRHIALDDDSYFTHSDALCLLEIFTKRLGIFDKNAEIAISICESDRTEIISCIKNAYSQLEKSEEDDYRLSSLPDPKDLTLQILKWMGIECTDKEIDEAINRAIL